jgi:hypothetical protein
MTSTAHTGSPDTLSSDCTNRPDFDASGTQTARIT